MGQLYHIQGWNPFVKASMGGNGFYVLLFPDWKLAVQSYTDLTQESANQAVQTMFKSWLEGHGWESLAKHDLPKCSIRVTWGQWGPEHITVPGNACGLDISDGISAPRNGKVLLPHNVDAGSQASLLLTIFLFFADCLVMNAIMKDYET